MKQIKGKYIRLTEAELTKLITEEVNKKLQMLMEYAIPRDKFIENAFAKSDQIIENWCLVHFCSITKTNVNNCYNHWKSELSTAMDNVWRKTIKNHKDYDTRYKAIVEAFEWNDLFEGSERIIVLTKNKFKKEDIDIKSTEYVQTCNDCFNAIKDMIDIMADYGNDRIEDYVNSI